MELKRIIILILLPIINNSIIREAECDDKVQISSNQNQTEIKREVGEGVTEPTDAVPTSITYSAIYYESHDDTNTKSPGVVSEGDLNGNKTGTSDQVGSYDIEIVDNNDSAVPTTEFPDFVSDETEEDISSGNGTSSSSASASSSSSTEIIPEHSHQNQSHSHNSHKSVNGSRSLSLITIRSKPRVRLSELARPSPNSTDHFYLGKLDVLKSKWVVDDIHGNYGTGSEGTSGSSGEGQSQGSSSSSSSGDIFTVGEDLKNTSLVFLECFANYPVHWTHDSLKVTPYSSKWDQLDVEDSDGHSFTNETSIFEIANHLGINGATFNGGKNYTVTLLVGRGMSSRFLQEKDSGNYSCVADSDDGTTVATSVYIYIPDEQRISPCIQSPCGSNAVCEVRHGNRSCSCLPGFQGNAYVKCREECYLNSDCTETEACVNNKCMDICIGACGKNSYCQIQDQIPMCYCIKGFQGDAYSQCNKTIKTDESDSTSSGKGTSTVITPGDDGNKTESQNQNEQSRDNSQIEIDGRTLASNQNQNKSSDLCSHCGINANCVSTENQTLVCKCKRNFFGNPYEKCSNENDETNSRNETLGTPCKPSPCGENTHCEEKYGRAICHCNGNHYGDPWTKCHPECLRRQDCPELQTCLQMKCQDACLHACGTRALCHAANHIASCSCPPNLTGDAYKQCDPIPVSEPETTNANNSTTT